MDEACHIVLEMDIPKAEPVEMRVQKIAMGMCNTRKKLAKIQMELNIKIIELQLKAQSSNLLEAMEHCMTTMADVIEVVASALMDCMTLF